MSYIFSFQNLKATQVWELLRTQKTKNLEQFAATPLSPLEKFKKLTFAEFFFFFVPPWLNSPPCLPEISKAI